jgi:hypothetical protein
MNLAQLIMGRRDIPGAEPDGPPEYSELPTEAELEDARRVQAAYDNLELSAGWKELMRDISDAAEDAMALWVKGGLPFEQTERLAARIETLRWVLALPNQRRRVASAIIDEAVELERTTQNPDDFLTDPEEGYL